MDRKLNVKDAHRATMKIHTQILVGGVSAAAHPSEFLPRLNHGHTRYEGQFKGIPSFATVTPNNTQAKGNAVSFKSCSSLAE